MRVFGLEEARRMVPFLLDTFHRVRARLEEARRLQSKIDHHRLEGDDAQLARAQVGHLADEVRAELMRIEDSGVQVKAVDGLVDFPSMMGDQLVLLCWKYPETNIDFWHDLEAGYEGRRQITDDAAFSRTYLS